MDDVQMMAGGAMHQASAFLLRSAFAAGMGHRDLPNPLIIMFANSVCDAGFDGE
jgi:hypothetical protein